MHDEDTALFSSLIDGVPTGFSDDIPGSNCFSKKDDEIEMNRQPLSIHMDNWRSSADRPDLTAELIAKEIAEGWVEQFPGGIEEAQQRWPKCVAVCRLGISHVG